MGDLVCCVAHDDSSPSLAVKDKDGKVLVHCHAGCSQRDVIEALKSRGLWPSGENNQRPVIVAEYSYTDERGELLYQIVRFQPKRFSQRYPDGHGNWIWKKHPRQVLYRLPEILEAPIVFLVEGEKDVETLREYGFVATTNAGGVNAPWLPSFTQTLAGREVIIIPDNDAPGKLRALRVARQLLGNVGRLNILELEGSAKDITDWFGQGHSELDLIAQVETGVCQ